MTEVQRHIHTFDQQQLAAVIDALRAATVSAPPRAPEPQQLTPELLAEAGIEPWTFHDPRQRVDVTAFVDDHNQLRLIPTTRRTEVPAGWRRVLLA